MPSCEQTPLLQPWGELASLVVQLVQVHPALAERLIFAPAPALHSYAIAIYREAHPTEVARLAARLYCTHPRILLREVWHDHAAGLWSALRKAGGAIWHQRRYECLNELLQSGARDHVLGAARLTPAEVTYFDYARRLDPLVLPASGALQCNIKRAKAFDSALMVLRHLRVLSADEQREVQSLRRLPPTGLRGWIKRRLGKVAVPPDGIRFSPPVSRIVTGRELLETAREAQNCLGSAAYLLALGTGQLIFLRMRIEQQLVVASLSRGREGWFLLEEVQGQDRWINNELRLNTVSFLRGAGIDAVDLSMSGEIDRFPMAEHGFADQLDDD